MVCVLIGNFGEFPEIVPKEKSWIVSMEMLQYGLFERPDYLNPMGKESLFDCVW